MSKKVTTIPTEQRAMRLVREFEGVGKSVSSIAIEGGRIEIGFSHPELGDDFDKIEMRYGEA